MNDPNPETVRVLRRIVAQWKAGHGLEPLADTISAALAAGEIPCYPGEMLEVGVWCRTHGRGYDLCPSPSLACDPVPMYRLSPLP